MKIFLELANIMSIRLKHETVTYLSSQCKENIMSVRLKHIRDNSSSRRHCIASQISKIHLPKQDPLKLCITMQKRIQNIECT